MAAPDDISFTVAPGRIEGLPGPNGSGDRGIERLFPPIPHFHMRTSPTLQVERKAKILLKKLIHSYDAEHDDDDGSEDATHAFSHDL